MRLKTLAATLLLAVLMLVPAQAVSFSISGMGKMKAVAINGFAGPDLVVAFGLYSFDSSYPTGGEALDLSSYFPQGLIGVSMPANSGYVFSYDLANKKILAYRTATLTPAGTVAAPVFTGDALAVHGHTLFLNNADVADGATTRVNAGTNLLGANTGSDISIATVANTSGAGGIVSVSAGTPSGTNSAPAFTGTATTAAALAEVGNAVSLSSVTSVPFIAFGFAP